MRKGAYLSEAYRFEEDCVFLLRHLAPVNGLESSARFVRRILVRLIGMMRAHALASLQLRYGTMPKEKWMEVGRPTQKKIHADFKKYLARVPEVSNRKLMR